MLSARTLIAGPSGPAQGRNWTGKPVKRVVPGRVRVIETRPNTLAKIASEEDASWPDETYVVTADGDPGGLRLPDDRVLDTETLAKVLAADPELAKLPKNVPVLLAVPFAQRTLALQLLANLLGRPVVGPSGEGRLVGDGSGNAHVPVLVDRDAKKAFGFWVPYEPQATTLPSEDREWTSIDGTKFRDSDVDIRPLVSEDHGRFGQISVEDDGERRGFEGRFSRYFSMRRLLHMVPSGSGDQQDGSEEITPDPAVYVFAAHGKPGRVTLTLRDGRKVWLSKQDAARYIAGLPEVRQLPPGHRLGLEVCFGASDGDPRKDHPAAMPPPHIDDPWGDVPLGQYTANESRRDLDAATTQTGLSYVNRVLFASGDGKRGRIVRFRPEPLAHELDGLARDAGLHTGSGAVSAETRATMLRLVRGLRDLFGNEVERDRGVPGGRYERLVKGIGALETLRANDSALSGITPLRRDMVAFYAQQHSGRPADTAAYESLLDFARERLAADPDAELTEAVAAPAVRVALNELGTSGEAVLRTVQGLAPGETPSPRQVASTLWAVVRSAKTLFNELPLAEREAHGRGVLHLDDTDPWDLSKQKTLWALTAKALAEGLDITDRNLLAAYHLKVTGAFDPAALLWQGQNVQG
ncbi:lonely Cys domain-containing protein, partial [Streptomyces sp. NPDC004749]